MSRRDFIIFTLACLFFAFNFVIAAWAVGRHGVPPFMLAACRAAFVIAIMGAFLFKPRPEKFTLLLIVCMCVGPVHLGFLYTGLQTATASGGAIVSQLMIPFATILSVIFLKERIGIIRLLAIAGAFIGTIIMIYKPDAMQLDIGLVYIIGAYISLAIGSVMMKIVGDVDWRIYVTWMAVLVFFFMGAASLMTEPSLGQIWDIAGWPLVITALYAAVGVTIIAHGQLFRIIRLYDVSLVVPLTLMVPLFSTIMGVTLLDEKLTVPIMIGGLLILPCVFIIARRSPD